MGSDGMMGLISLAPFTGRGDRREAVVRGGYRPSRATHECRRPKTYRLPPPPATPSGRGRTCLAGPRPKTGRAEGNVVST